MKRNFTINGDKFTLFISEAKIRKRICQLAKKISRDYNGSIPIFIGVLNGSFIFFSDLIREISIDCEVDFIKLSSYGDAKISSGNIRLLKELNCQIEGRDIIIVEDIVDSGLSIEFIKNLIMKQNPKSLKVVTLLLKKEVVKINFPIDYVGFEIPTYFVVGYGLDYAQRIRHLKSIYRLVEK
ncbi:MAG: Hypoxanthine-guanine phosphoribosyltransferase [Ignavibacteriae bacterium]|nr:MAG: Hypoxanthine-guanine phosphoribosyltransferase [Ignavibacteriota bacterium]